MFEDRVTEFKKPLAVLVIEDTHVDRHMLETMLAPSTGLTTRLVAVASLKEGMEILAAQDFEVVILDLDLPDSRGEQSLKALRKHYPGVAIVVNTGAYEDDLGLKTLGWGAQDFMVKGKYTAYGLNKTLHYALERKRLEDALKEAYARLQRTQHQLIQSEKLKVVGGLATGVAHEVKNPLATILYGITFLKEHIKERDEKIVCVFQNIQEAVRRADTIITDLLDFSGLSHFKMRRQDVHGLLEKALSLTRYQIDKNHIRVGREFWPEPIYASLDANKMDQVLVNLILNACHAMPDGGDLLLKTEVHCLDERFSGMPFLGEQENFRPGQQVARVVVEDTGVGIKEEDLARVFDPFFTSRRTKGGVGLGLSISRNIVQMHKGCLWLENRSEGGARAHLVLPVMED